jgi:hypothetical protein
VDLAKRVQNVAEGTVEIYASEHPKLWVLLKRGLPADAKNESRRQDGNDRDAHLLAPELYPADGLSEQERKRAVLEFIAHRDSRQHRNAQVAERYTGLAQSVADVK